jgi:hypothetical protein
MQPQPNMLFRFAKHWSSRYELVAPVALTLPKQPINSYLLLIIDILFTCQYISLVRVNTLPSPLDITVYSLYA